MTSKPGALALTLAVCGALHAAPAAEAIDPGTFRAIRDCVLDGDLDRRYSNEQLRRAQQHVPSDYAEYSNCTEIFEAAILDTGGAAPRGGGGAGFDGSEPGRSAPDPEDGRGAGADGAQRSFARDSGAPGSAHERHEGAARPAASTSASGFPWPWLLGGAAVLAAAGWLFRAVGQPIWGASGRGG